MNAIIKNIVSETGLSVQEAWWLIESITQKSKALLIASDYTLIGKEAADLAQAIEKIKINSIPLAYLIGNVPFANLTIEVKPPILIPRQETEEWVCALIEQLKPYKNSIQSILDIGTGSGCIALALAQAFPQAMVTALDINPEALKLAKINALKNNIKNIIFIESNLFEALKNQQFDLVVSNPPYIAPAYKSTLQRSVMDWEDHDALFAKDNGLKIIKAIISELVQLLSDLKLPTKFVIECDPEQIDTIVELCKKESFIPSVFVDTFGNQRTVWGSLKS